MATYYWVGGTGTWDNSNKTNWAASSGGSGGVGPPTATDAVIFDANSGTGTCTTATGSACAAVTLNSSTLALTLGANHTATGTFTFTQGSLALNGNSGNWTLTCLAFSSSNTNTRSIDFGSGSIVLTASNATLWVCGTLTNFSYTGTPTVVSNYAGSTGTRTFQHGNSAGGSESTAVSFNITGGSDIVALYQHVKDLDLSGFSGTLSNFTRTIYGNLTLSANMTCSSGALVTIFAATSGTKLITTNANLTIDFPVTFNGAGGTWRLEDNFQIGSSRALTLMNGTLNANGKNVTIGTFALGSGTKTLTLGSGTWTVQGATWNANTNVANFTVSASAGIINMTSGSAKTFSGGGKTWPTLNQGGAGALTIAQSNTFANITNSVQPATITLTSGTTQTVSAFGVSGTAGNLITLNSSSAGSRATLSDASGTVSLSYVSVKDIAATGGAGWNAYTSNGNVDAGNNTGWVFDPAPSDVSVEFFMNLRSFTEPRRF